MVTMIIIQKHYTKNRKLKLKLYFENMLGTYNEIAEIHQGSNKIFFH